MSGAPSRLTVVAAARLLPLTGSEDPRAVPVIVSAPPPARHHNLFAIGIAGPIQDQGFLLSDGTFADRKRAADVAIEAGQIERLQWPPHLYSEDLW